MSRNRGGAPAEDGPPLGGSWEHVEVAAERGRQLAGRRVALTATDRAEYPGRRASIPSVEMQLHADWAVTMGCGDVCPYVPTTVDAWDIPDPAGRPVSEVREIRDMIDERVRELAHDKIDAIAVALADRGHQVTLSTTDPAAHLVDTLADETQAGLQVERIDPSAETARYSAEVLHAAVGLDAEGRALLEEDLRSPCTEEIAVFRAFARTIDEANDRIVVLDTAPTGHTLLLLDSAESYQREIKRTNANVPDAVRELAQRLRDPQFAHVIIVTLAESTPVHEADRLQADLRRAGIEPFGWLVNASLAQTSTTHPTLLARARAERVHLDRVQHLSEHKTWAVAWQHEPPTGITALRKIAGAAPAMH
jgi:hypothetical protein